MDTSRSFRMELEGLDLQQLQASRACNDYVDRPVFREPAPRQDRPFGPAPPAAVHRALPRSQSHNLAGYGLRLSRSSTVSSSASRNSAASDQRLMVGLTPSPSGLVRAVRSQPKGELKPQASPGKGRTRAELEEAELGAHMFICECCGRCKCQECGAPRQLPSCWACGDRCLCSAECAAEHATCLCCVKGLFYHCWAQDDEDSCADRPCSCSTSHGLARWGAMALMSLCLPCLCCHPPARLCLAACRRAHDRAARPGCRCRNTNTVCRKISASGGGGGGGYPALRSKSLEKPL